MRSATSRSRLAADDRDMPGLAAAKDHSRSATAVSNRTGVAARLLMTTL